MIILVALILLNLSLIPVGITLIWLAVRSRVDELSCNICGYDLRGSLGVCKQCPECGTPLDDPQMAGRKRIVHRPLLILGIVLLAIPPLCDIAFVVIVLVALFSLAGW